MNNEQEGEKAAKAYYASQGFASLTRHIKPEDAIKLFLPPVIEQMTQISMPLPKARKEWLKGFSEEQTGE